MVGWRTKFVFMLIIYFSGFATAVYFIGPLPKKGRGSQSHRDRLFGTVDSRDVTNAMNTGMHRAADLSKELMERASVLIKERIEEVRQRER